MHLVLAMLLGLGGCGSEGPATLPPPVPQASTATYGDFTITTDQGPLTLSSLRGRVVVVYFGYAACPDVCPTTLAAVAAAHDGLDDDLKAHTAVLFVSVDPTRDTPERLGPYVRFFDPSFLAGTASEGQIASIAADWGVIYRRVDNPHSAMGYTVDHSTQSFVVDARGRMVSELPHGSTVAHIQSVLRTAHAAPPVP